DLRGVAAGTHTIQARWLDGSNGAYSVFVPAGESATIEVTPAAAHVRAATGGSAPECAEGRVSTAATAGRCCWPGQYWTDERERCEGAPRCAEGWLADGPGCVRAGGADSADGASLDRGQVRRGPGLRSGFGIEAAFGASGVASGRAIYGGGAVLAFRLG